MPLGNWMVWPLKPGSSKTMPLASRGLQSAGKPVMNSMGRCCTLLKGISRKWHISKDQFSSVTTLAAISSGMPILPSLRSLKVLSTCRSCPVSAQPTVGRLQGSDQTATGLIHARTCPMTMEATLAAVRRSPSGSVLPAGVFACTMSKPTSGTRLDRPCRSALQPFPSSRVSFSTIGSKCTIGEGGGPEAMEPVRASGRNGCAKLCGPLQNWARLRGRSVFDVNLVHVTRLRSGNDINADKLQGLAAREREREFRGVTSPWSLPCLCC